MDIAAALPIATSIPVTNLRQYINSNLGYNNQKIQPLCIKITTVNPFLRLLYSMDYACWFKILLFSSKFSLKIATALPIATSTLLTEASRYIQWALYSKIATVNPFEVAISNGLCFNVVDSILFNQISFGNSDRAAYSNLNPDDGGQLLYPMSTVLGLLTYFASMALHQTVM